MGQIAKDRDGRPAVDRRRLRVVGISSRHRDPKPVAPVEQRRGRLADASSRWAGISMALAIARGLPARRSPTAPRLSPLQDRFLELGGLLGPTGVFSDGSFLIRLRPNSRSRLPSRLPLETLGERLCSEQARGGTAAS